MRRETDNGVDFSILPSLPSGWSWCVPADICIVVASGSTPTADKMFDYEGEIPFIKVYNLTHSGTLNFSVKPTFVSRETHETLLARSRVKPGDVLINIVGPPLGKVSVVPPDHSEWNINQAIVMFRPYLGVYEKYLAYTCLTHSIMSRVTRLAKATAGQFNIGVGMCRHLLPIPLAPTNEQRRIVAKIEELFSDLDAGVAALERIRANLKRYRAAVLKAAVEGRLTEDWRAKHPKTEPATKLLERILAERRQKWEEDQLAKFDAADKTPLKGWREKYVEPAAPDTTALPELLQGWCWATVDQLLIEPTCNGISIKGTDTPPGVAALRLNAMSSSGFNYEECRYIPISEEVAAGLAIREGDFFVSRGNGSLHLLGRGTLAQAPPAIVVFPDTMIRLRFSMLGCQLRFMSVVWESRHIRRQIESEARTTAGIYKISQGDIGAFHVPLAPLSEQKEILLEVERRLSIVNEAEAQVDANLKRAARLRQSILKRAFEGRLVPQDPTDEPAQKLLERICQERESSKLQEDKNGATRRIRKKSSRKQK